MIAADVALGIFVFSLVTLACLAWIFQGSDQEGRVVIAMTVYGVVALVAMTIAVTLSVAA